VRALAVEVGRPGQESLFHHPLDDLLDEILELLACGLLVAVRGLAQQSLQRLVRQHAAAEERLQNRVMQRLHGPVFLVVERIAPRIVEPAGEQQVRELRHEILEVDLVEQVAGVFRVAELH
jgi:hypothetical protein